MLNSNYICFAILVSPLEDKQMLEVQQRATKFEHEFRDLIKGKEEPKNYPHQKKKKLKEDIIITIKFLSGFGEVM